jgi:NADPH:quinone reductase-like Zn-dependent oxidoreductase
MKAIVYEKYGTPDVLQLKEVEKPTVKANEVLIKVHAASLNKADCYMLNGMFLIRLMTQGFLNPKHKILGADISGIVEAIGKDVKSFKVGDSVFGDLSSNSFGGLSEYVAVPENIVALKQKNTNFNEAAALPMAGVTALQAIRDKAKVKAGDKVLINGASGGVGTFMLQIAKALGAEVTAVVSTENLEIAKSIGADYVIDYKKEDFTKNSKKYDAIILANGNILIDDCKRLLNPDGICVVTGGSMSQIFKAMLKGSKNVKSMTGTPNKEDLIYLAKLIDEGKIKPVIDHTYKLAEIKDAFNYLIKGQTKGKVVITIAEN